MNSHSKSKPRHQKFSSNTGRFILDFVVDSSCKHYNKIAKDEKDPEGPYAINTDINKPVSSKPDFYMHCILQKSINYEIRCSTKSYL